MNQPSIPRAYRLRPGVSNPKTWFPDRPSSTEWHKIRKLVLERDNYSCVSCGHKAQKYMQVHHRNESGLHSLDNLIVHCVACHAVEHLGRNLALKSVEVWSCDFSQVQIIKLTRSLIKKGLSLQEINSQFSRKQGPFSPDSLDFANELVQGMGDNPRAYLPEPLCCFFVNFSRWQIE
jgi:hypothetical protein